MGTNKIERNFIVPKGDVWPSETHGVPLGRVYCNIRSTGNYKPLHSPIVALGFPIHTVSRDFQFDRVYNALSVYKSLYGNLRIPVKYQIPWDDERYPLYVRGMNLGTALAAIRQGKSFRQRRSQFAALGVSFDARSYLERAGLDIISSSFLAYRNINKSGNVPRSFVVPVDPRFPERTWGCNLGEIVCNLKESKALNDAKLFNVRIKSRKVMDTYFEVIYTALVFFKRRYGHLNVRFDFVIPDQSPAFPVHTWGFPLGTRIVRIKNGAFETHHDRLRAIGFNFTLKKPNFSVIREGLQAYKAIHGDLLVPARFVIPSGDSRYPESTWGIKLGLHLKHIRSKTTMKQHYDEVLAMGAKKTFIKAFESYDMFLSAFLIYKKVHGHGDVPAAYRIGESDEAYPAEVRGMALGRAVDRIRRFGRFADRRSELEHLGLRFQASVKSMVQILTAVRTFKEIHGHVNIPVSYAIPRGDKRFSEDLWGYRLGGRFNDIKKSVKAFDEDKQLLALGVPLKRGNVQLLKDA